MASSIGGRMIGGAAGASLSLRECARGGGSAATAAVWAPVGEGESLPSRRKREVSGARAMPRSWSEASPARAGAVSPSAAGEGAAEAGGSARPSEPPSVEIERDGPAGWGDAVPPDGAAPDAAALDAVAPDARAPDAVAPDEPAADPADVAACADVPSSARRGGALSSSPNGES